MKIILFVCTENKEYSLRGKPRTRRGLYPLLFAARPPRIRKALRAGKPESFTLIASFARKTKVNFRILASLANKKRSQMAEAIFNHRAKEIGLAACASSAGTIPAQVADPYVCSLLLQYGIDYIPSTSHKN